MVYFIIVHKKYSDHEIVHNLMETSACELIRGVYRSAEDAQAHLERMRSGPAEVHRQDAQDYEYRAVQISLKRV